jgi:hypothetical protein
LEISSPTTSMMSARRLSAASGSHQQRGELAGDIAAHRDGPSSCSAGWRMQRRVARLAAVVDRQPSWRSASTRSPMGRSCMRGTPSG